MGWLFNTTLVFIGLQYIIKSKRSKMISEETLVVAKEKKKRNFSLRNISDLNFKFEDVKFF